MKHMVSINYYGRKTEAWIEPDALPGHKPGWWAVTFYDWKLDETRNILKRTEAEAKARLDRLVAEHGGWDESKA